MPHPSPRTASYSALAFSDRSQPTIYDFDDTRELLASFINSAAKTMDVEKLEFSDSTVGDVMVDRPNADVAVRVVTENPTQPNGFCSHAQAMVTDCGLSAQEVEAGSVNIGGNSLG